MPISSTGQGVDVSQATQNLPVVGYTSDQLKAYIMRQLGSPTWTVELTSQQVQDCIQDSLGLYSQWCPWPKYGSIRLYANQFAYLTGVDVGLGISDVSFCEPNPVPTEIFYGNLIDPAPLFRTGLDEYDTFMRWRKTWMRITSVQPNWTYDMARKQLLIHNPLERFYAGVTCLMPFSDCAMLTMQGAIWVKEYSLERARYLWGDVLSKYSGAIPGPLKDLQLDNQKRANAEKRLDALLEKLRGMQTTMSISID